MHALIRSRHAAVVAMLALPAVLHAQGDSAQAVPSDLKPLLLPRRSEMRLVVARYNQDRTLLGGNYVTAGGGRRWRREQGGSGGRRRRRGGCWRCGGAGWRPWRSRARLVRGDRTDSHIAGADRPAQTVRSIVADGAAARRRRQAVARRASR